MKQTIKLNETRLRNIVAESVKKVLEESDINNAVANRNRDLDMAGNTDRYKRQMLHLIKDEISTRKQYL